jgi:hypothetical protein
MINRFAPREQICLLNANTQCDRIWVFQLDGLHISHFQTPWKEDPASKSGDAASGAGRAQASDSAAYDQCVRGCVGPRL